MANHVRPLNDRIIVRGIEGDEKSSGGIIIPDTAEEKPQEGRVVAVGEGRREDGKRIPIFVQAWIWKDKVIGLPDEYSGLSSTQQVNQAARIVRRYFGETRGQLGIWGTITGYRLQRTYDHAVMLNTDGNVREGFNRDAEPQPPELRIGGKQLPVGLFTGE